MRTAMVCANDFQKATWEVGTEIQRYREIKIWTYI